MPRALPRYVLRITSQSTTDSLTLKLEGTLRGPWVDEVQRAWSASADKPPRKPVKVDLAGVSFIDTKGCELLLQMQKAGAVLQGVSPFIRHILDGSGEEPQRRKKNRKQE